MRCLNCDSTELEEKNLRLTPRVKNDVVEVFARSYVCKKCSSPIMDTHQMNEYRRASIDAYRELHNLLTSKQIVEYRETLGMSQATFAKYLNVGEASIKRWETYHIQDAGQDDHIRTKCDEIRAGVNLLTLQLKYSKADIYNGWKKFSGSLFKDLQNYYREHLPDSQASMGNLYFYTDFLHFKKFNKSISGMKYVPLKGGPFPYEYHLIEKLNLDSCVFSIEKKSSRTFDDQEMQTIQYICSFYKQKGSKVFHVLASQEKGFLDTKQSEFISYEFAKKLLI